MLPDQPFTGLELAQPQNLLAFPDTMFNEEPLGLHIGYSFPGVLCHFSIGKRVFYFFAGFCLCFSYYQKAIFDMIGLLVPNKHLGKMIKICQGSLGGVPDLDFLPFIGLKTFTILRYFNPT